MSEAKEFFVLGSGFTLFFFLSPYFFISLQCDLWSRAKRQEISCFWEEYHSHTSNLLTLSQLNWQSSFPFGIHVLESNELPKKNGVCALFYFNAFPCVLTSLIFLSVFATYFGISPKQQAGLHRKVSLQVSWGKPGHRLLVRTSVTIRSCHLLPIRQK